MIKSSTPLRVLVVDDHPMMRRGIVEVVQEAGDIVVVAEAGDGLAAQTKYLEHLPDVTLMDLSMPRCNGIDAIHAIRRYHPDACIVALSTFGGDGQVYRALAAGAAGYILKSTLSDGIADLIRSAHAGRNIHSADLTRQLASSKAEQLTAREHDVLSAVARGHSNKEVARQLGIAEETVKGYLSNVMQKLHANDRTHAVVIALRRGMLD